MLLGKNGNPVHTVIETGSCLPTCRPLRKNFAAPAPWQLLLCSPHSSPIFMMTNSGALGSMNQIRQLAGMRILMASASGPTIEVPTKASFREGLSVLEHFLSLPENARPAQRQRPFQPACFPGNVCMYKMPPTAAICPHVCLQPSRAPCASKSAAENTGSPLPARQRCPGRLYASLFQKKAPISAGLRRGSCFIFQLAYICSREIISSVTSDWGQSTGSKSR